MILITLGRPATVLAKPPESRILESLVSDLTSVRSTTNELPLTASLKVSRIVPPGGSMTKAVSMGPTISPM